MKLSVVTSLYCSEPHVAEFCRRFAEEAGRLTQEWELVLVNDGSPDASLARALEAQKRDPHITVVDLSRNHGHHRAVMVGLSLTSGERVYLTDSDLEEPPELLGRMWAELEAHGGEVDVVFGIQERRRGGALGRWTGGLYYRLFNALSPVKIAPNLVNARLMTRRYVRALLRHREREVFLAGLWALTGFRQVTLGVTKSSRTRGGYDLGRRLQLATDSLLSFSTRPLWGGMVAGLGCAVVGGVGLLLRWAGARSGPGAVLSSVWLLGGLNLAWVSLAGLYAAKALLEAKRRPYAVIRRVYRGGG